MSTDGDKRFGERRTARLPADDPLSQSPIAELQRLAVSADSETARVNALRLLLDRMDRQRERDEARAAVEAQQEGQPEYNPLSEYIGSLSGDALDGELDAMLSAYIGRALEDPDGHASFPQIVGEFRRAVERHVAALEDVGRIEQEVQRRAEALAAEKYRSRDFEAVGPSRPVAVPEPTDDDQGEDGDDAPGFTAPRDRKPERPPVHPFVNGTDEPTENPVRRNGRRRRRPYGGGVHRLN